MDAKAAPTPFVPTFTLLIGGGVLLAGLFTMLGDAASTAPGLALAAIGAFLRRAESFRWSIPPPESTSCMWRSWRRWLAWAIYFQRCRRQARSGRRPDWLPQALASCARCCLRCT